MSEKPKCKGEVWSEWSFKPHGCSRSASTPAGYCKQHDPELLAARKKERDDKWRVEWDRARAESEAKRALDLQRDADAAIGRALREMAALGSSVPVRGVDGVVFAEEILSALAPQAGGA